MSASRDHVGTCWALEGGSAKGSWAQQGGRGTEKEPQREATSEVAALTGEDLALVAAARPEEVLSGPAPPLSPEQMAAWLQAKATSEVAALAAEMATAAGAQWEEVLSGSAPPPSPSPEQMFERLAVWAVAVRKIP
jgi:hypothetical protein